MVGLARLEGVQVAGAPKPLGLTAFEDRAGGGRRTPQRACRRTIPWKRRWLR
jgi:hypothetical protein